MKFYQLNLRKLPFAVRKSLMVMKLTLLLIIAAFFQSTAATYAQKISLSERNAPLERVLRKIKAQSGMDFFYSSALMQAARPVSIQVENASLDEVLKQAFRNQPLTFVIELNAVIVKELPAPPPVNVKGRVTDENGHPLPGVTIRVKDAPQATLSDEKGAFALNNVPDNAVLVISFIGYTTRELPVSADPGTIRLERADSKLNEVIVVGYGTVKRSDVTGAIASLKPDPQDAAKSLTVENLLQGKLAGVSVSNSVASPGAAMSVTIRGANSLRGDNQPLYVIDNIPQASAGEFAASAFGGGDFQIAQSPLTNLNPADIEDIQVLKDASATAIYGSRGANGVILITTKKGRSGKAKVSAGANYTLVDATRLRNMMSLQEFAAYRNEKTGAAAQQYFPVNGEMRYVFANEVYDPADPSTYRILQERNWQKEIYRQALSQQYNVAMNGGSSNIKYYLSADYKHINGMIDKTGLRQGSMRLNLSGDVVRNLTFNVSMSGALKENNMMSGGNTRGGATGSITRTAIDAAPYEIPADDPLLLSNEEARTSTLGWLTDYDDITDEKSARVSADLNWKISKNFSYVVRAGGNLMLQNRSRWYGLQLFKGLNDNGSLGISRLNSNNYTVENLVNYNAKVGKVVDINATAGVTYDEYHWLNHATTAIDFDFKDLRTKGLHMAGVINEMQPAQRDYQLLSYLGRVNLSFFGGRYLATVTGRADGSSKFRQHNRWAWFPSFSLAWRLDQESALKDLAWLSQLKLRGGFGKTGSQSIAPYNSFYDYAQVIDYATAAGEKELAIAVSKLQNSGLKWETTEAWNAGLDFGFFRNRISGTIDVYRKLTRDLLIEKALPPSASFSTILMNQGSLSNKGVEITLSADVISRKELTWSVSGNIGINRARIEELGYPDTKFGNETYRAYLGNSIGDHFGAANIFIAGRAPGLFWGYKTDGIIQEGQQVPASSVFSRAPGNINVLDVTGDGVVDVNDKTIIGNPNPGFTYGFQTAVSYKDLKLSAAFYGVSGGQVLNGNLRYEQTPAMQTGNLTSQAWQRAWRPGAPSNLYPSVTSNLQNTVYDRYIEDGSFLRCSDITLSYALPARILKGWSEGISVFASVKNLFLVTGYNGYDPEMRTFSFDGLRPGIDLNSFSNPRQYVLGLNIRL